MNKCDMTGAKLYSGGKEVTKEQVEKAVEDYLKKINSPEYQKEIEEAKEFLNAKNTSSQEKKPAFAEKRIDYYEFPNGVIVKLIHGDRVYRFLPETGTWEVDYSLTAEFAWDRPYGEPCGDLRRKADISCDLPPFPEEKEFYPGNTVYIGAYPQKSLHDYSPIPWIVLDTDGTSALCISKYCLIASGYCDPEKAYGKPELLWYENSLAREICKGYFLDKGFSETEKKRLIPRKLRDVKLGGECTDSVFLLSEREVQHYFPEEYQKRAELTPYAIQKGARSGPMGEGWGGWWILPEENPYSTQVGDIYPKAVFPTGEIRFHGRNVYHMDFAIRPCIQIKYKND